MCMSGGYHNASQVFFSPEALERDVGSLNTKSLLLLLYFLPSRLDRHADSKLCLLL